MDKLLKRTPNEKIRTQRYPSRSYYSLLAGHIVSEYGSKRNYIKMLIFLAIISVLHFVIYFFTYSCFDTKSKDLYSTL